MPLRVRAGVPITAPPLAAAALAPAAPVAGVTLGVPLVAQAQNQWCWAACTAMIARYLGAAEPNQCELANFLFGRTDCCTSPGSAQCNRPAQTADVVRVYKRLGINLVGPDNPLSAATVKMELDAGRPFEVGLLWSGGGGHVAVVYGYTAQGLVLVRDPWFGTLSVTYNCLFMAYGMGRWFVSYGRFTSDARTVDMTIRSTEPISAVRSADSLVGWQIGQVVGTRPNAKVIQWEGGSKETIRHEQAPKELIKMGDEEWLQAMVERHPDTYEFRRITELKLYAPWSGKLDDDNQKKIELIPTIRILPETTWE